MPDGSRIFSGFACTRSNARASLADVSFPGRQRPTIDMMKKQIIHVPRQQPLSPFGLASLAVRGAVLAPIYALIGKHENVPGMHFRNLCTQIALRAIVGPINDHKWKHIYNLLFYPMDSTRHFEFDFAWKLLSTRSRPIGTYLDVSSPRFLPLVLLARNLIDSATLLNPDGNDMSATRALAQTLKVEDRCTFLTDTIGAARLPDSHFDLVTSISVVEHISDDADSIRRIHAATRSGGTIMITVPCAAEAFEQFIDHDYYGVLPPDESGYYFWQRFYDQSLIQSVFYSILGTPTNVAVYGERESGLFAINAEQKRANRKYPFWKEPRIFARDYQPFACIGDLPGEGVIAMEFTKE